jgi:hypothetical protein
MDEARGMAGSVHDAAGTSGPEASAVLEARLEAFAHSVGGSSDGAALAAGVSGAPVAGLAGGEFLRAVAARRVAVAVKALLAMGGVAGVLAAVILVALRTAPAPEAPAPRVRHEEPTFWNLREGVENPAALDDVAGLGIRESAAPQGDAAGVAPGTWPDDLRP